MLGIKENVPDTLKVKYKGATYYPVGYELKFEMGQPAHIAILHEIDRNAVLYCLLSMVNNCKA